MTSSIVADTPKCPDCSVPMRLTRVLPTALPKTALPKPASSCAHATGQLSRASCLNEKAPRQAGSVTFGKEPRVENAAAYSQRSGCESHDLAKSG
jgi:hypothetical protein